MEPVHTLHVTNHMHGQSLQVTGLHHHHQREATCTEQGLLVMTRGSHYCTAMPLLVSIFKEKQIWIPIALAYIQAMQSVQLQSCTHTHQTVTHFLPEAYMTAPSNRHGYTTSSGMVPGGKQAEMSRCHEGKQSSRPLSWCCTKKFLEESTHVPPSPHVLVEGPTISAATAAYQLSSSQACSTCGRAPCSSS